MDVLRDIDFLLQSLHGLQILIVLELSHFPPVRSSRLAATATAEARFEEHRGPILAEVVEEFAAFDNSLVDALSGLLHRGNVSQALLGHRPAVARVD